MVNEKPVWFLNWIYQHFYGRTSLFFDWYAEGLHYCLL